MSTSAHPREKTPALLELREFPLHHETGASSAVHFFLSGTSATLMDDASELLSGIVEPKRSAHIRVHGEAPERLLRTCQLGFAPKRLPAPERTSLSVALGISARLIGQSKTEVARRLQQCGLADFHKKKLAQLSPLEQRLSGIAHALIGSPSTIVLEDPFHGLDDHAAADVASLLTQELQTRSWLLGAHLRQPASLALALSSDQLVTLDGGNLQISNPKEMTSNDYWIRSEDSLFSLGKRLRSEGGTVTSSPNPHVLLVRGLKLTEISKIATTHGVALEELHPAGASAFRPRHARRPG